MGRTPTQKKNDSIARYKWLKVVFLEIDSLKVEIASINNRLDKIEKTERYISDSIQSMKEGEKQNGTRSS